jgi:hypothetical protein
MKVAQQKKYNDLNYVGSFDYTFDIITKVELYKGYMDTTHTDEAS